LTASDMDAVEPQGEPGIRFTSALRVASAESRRHPRKDPALRVEAKGDAEDRGTPLFVDAGVLAEVLRFARSDTTRELGGLLVGGRFEDGGEEFVLVERFLDGRHLESLPASARFTHDTFDNAWERIDSEADQGYTQLVLGWFHTHPGFGPGFSERDRFIHERFFDLPFLVGLVVDPLREELLFHGWRDGEIRTTGFFLVSPA
jgi:proteasome lid subunit RPN8/RPN11